MSEQDNTIREGLYLGHVVHQRMQPVSHKLKYFVFSCLFDCDQLADLSQKLRWFSFNKFNLFTFNEKDFGDGGDVAQYIRAIAHEAGFGEVCTRFMMLCYPRILGYGFNPITVYYCLDDEGEIRLMVYEVRNTFGEKTTYVLPVENQKTDIIAQQCDKAFFVSPFNNVEGYYQFRVTKPLDSLTLGVLLKSKKGGILRAHFKGDYLKLNDKNLISALLKTGWMTAKVMWGIHFEAAKLWVKGMRLKKRPSNPPKVTIVGTRSNKAKNYAE